MADILGFTDQLEIAQPADIPEQEEQGPLVDPKSNADKFDLPVPGQSLTAEPGAAAYETPPEFTKMEDATDYLFNNLMAKPAQKKALQAMNEGVPVSLLAEPILLHGVQEGKWSMDMALMLMPTFSVMLYGLGKKAGVNVKMNPPQIEDPGIDTRLFKDVFKNSAEERKQALLKSVETETKEPEGFTKRRNK